jgi:hypothetical protein
MKGAAQAIPPAATPLPADRRDGIHPMRQAGTFTR